MDATAIQAIGEYIVTPICFAVIVWVLVTRF